MLYACMYFMQHLYMQGSCLTRDVTGGQLQSAGRCTAAWQRTVVQQQGLKAWLLVATRLE